MGRFRRGLAVGFAAGYYFGAKAGRDRYVQLRRAVDAASNKSNDVTEFLRVGVQSAQDRMLRWKAGPGDAPQSPIVDIDVVAVEDLPTELRSRVVAAAAHPEYRHIARRSGDDGQDVFEVHSVAGGGLVHMELSLRPGGSVAERTETFPRDQIVRVDTATDPATIDVEDAAGRRSLSLPPGIAEALLAGGAS